MRFSHFNISLLFLILISYSANAQNSFQLIPESSSIRVFGSSNVQDWEMFVDLNTEDSNYTILAKSIKNLKDVQFKIKSLHLTSEESSMKKKAHKALKLSTHPFINFSLEKIIISNHTTNSFEAFALGTFHIAGQSKKVQLPLHGNFLSDEKMNLSGHIDLKMSDFKIKAPTALFGAIATTDGIKVLYSLDFSSKQKLTEEMIAIKLAP